MKDIFKHFPVTEANYEYDYLVCFEDRKKCNSVLGRIFGHIILWRNITAICSVRIEPTLEGLLIVPYTTNISTFRKSVEESYKCYVWRTKAEDFKKRWYLPELFDCVTITKRLLGIQTWWIITPKQLEKYIKHNGGIQWAANPSQQ